MPQASKTPDAPAPTDAPTDAPENGTPEASEQDILDLLYVPDANPAKGSTDLWIMRGIEAEGQMARALVVRDRVRNRLRGDLDEDMLTDEQADFIEMLYPETGRGADPRTKEEQETSRDLRLLVRRFAGLINDGMTPDEAKARLVKDAADRKAKRDK